MNTLLVNTSFNISLQFQTAPFHIRFFAWFIDCFFLGIYYYAFTSFFLDKFYFEDNVYAVWIIVVRIPILIYHLMFELFNKGQSLGKLIFGIKVASDNGREASYAQIFIRWLMRPVDFGIFLGLLMLISQEYFFGLLLIIFSITSFILFLTTKHNQKLGDLAAGVVVIYKRLPYNLNDTIFRYVSNQDYKVSFPQVMNLSDNDINIINNVIHRHQRSPIDAYLSSIALKVKSALNIETTLPDDFFLETLLNDYNFLSKK